MLHRTNRIVPATLAALLVALLSSSAEAQFNRGQRGNFNVNPSPLLGELQRESVQKELGLTADQLTGIEEVRAAQVANPEDMAAAFDALRQAESDEERAAIQAEMQFMREEREAALRTDLAAVLDEKQMTRLDQLLLHRTGLTALTQAPTAEKLGLTDEQQDEVADLLADRVTALRELGFGATADERTAVQKDFDSKVLEVLTAKQQEQWTALLGPAPPTEPEPAVDDRFAQQRGNRGDRGGRGDRGDSPFSPSPTPSVTASATQGPPVSSFEPADPASAEKMSFAFRQAPWAEVLRDFALRAGLNLELIATPPGTFEYHDRNLYTPMEALDVINGALLQRGYLLVKRDQFLVCVNIDQGPPPNVIPYITAAELPNRGKNEMLTVVFPVKGITDVLGLADQVQQMLGPQGKSVGVQAAGALVVTDIGTNLNRVNEMLSAMSALAGPYDVKFQGYPLEHITAGEAESTLRSLLGMQFTVTNVSSGGRGGDDRRRGGPDWGNSNNQGNSGNNNNRNASPFDAELLAKTQFAADARTNQLLVTGPTIVHVLIDQAIQNIDVEATSALASTAGSTKPYLQIYTVRSSDAGEVAKTLDVLIPGVVVNEDGRNGRIHVMASADQHREVEAHIRQLDGMGGGQTMAVIPLSKMDPLTAVSTLQSMFLSEGTNAPTVQADLIGRQVMIRGSSDQVAQIKTLLAQLGEDGTGTRRSGSGGNIRRFSLSGRDADSLLDVIDQAWHATQPNRIQVVPADRRSPIRSLMGPDDRTSIQDYLRDVPPRTQRRAQESNEGPISSRERKPVTQFVGFVQEVEATNADAESAGEEPAVAADDAAEEAVVDEAGPAAAEPTAPGAQTAPAERSESQSDPRGTEVAPGIFIQIQGDELVIVSEDEEALDRFEDLLSEALSAIPPQTTWTVFTLQTADATQAAAMLEQLIPDASVSQVATTDSSIFGSLSSSFSSMGSSLMSATGLSGTTSSVLRIIPEPRLNALFVSGPSAKVEEVADFLDILDASDWPGTLRDRVPRMIPVEYAEVTDVYRIVRDSYKDYIEGEQSNPFGGGNALAMFMGGGGGNSRGGRDNNNNRQQREIKLTVAMDEQTSHLIVSADEALYQEIKSLVDSLDRAALNARRTIRVVALQNTSTSAVQSTLGAVMPRVRVSTSGSRTSSSSSSSQSSSPTSSPSSSSSGSSQSQSGMSQDQMRQMWMQRMQQQQGSPQPSGDSGRSRFGTGGSTFGGGGGAAARQTGRR